MLQPNDRLVLNVVARWPGQVPGPGGPAITPGDYNGPMSSNTTPWKPTRAQVEAARGRRLTDLLAPGLRVLFLSDDPDTPLVVQPAPDPGSPVLCKPFGPETLARAVREALDRPA